MKYILLIAGLCLLLRMSPAQTPIQSMLDNLQEQDTLYINFCIASGEFASVHKGLLLYKKDGGVIGRYVLYKYGVSLLPNKLVEVHANVKAVPLERDSIVAFYNGIKTNYFVMKTDWRLDTLQIQYLRKYLLELDHFEPEGRFSNAPDFYSVITGKAAHVKIDGNGKWNKFTELKKALAL